MKAVQKHHAVPRHTPLSPRREVGRYAAAFAVASSKIEFCKGDSQSCFVCQREYLLVVSISLKLLFD